MHQCTHASKHNIYTIRAWRRTCSGRNAAHDTAPDGCRDGSAPSLSHPEIKSAALQHRRHGAVRVTSVPCSLQQVSQDLLRHVVVN